MKLEPGWLMTTCHEAHMHTMMNHSPSFVRACRITAAITPIPENEAQELFDLMNARFVSWTGRTLSEVAAGRAALGAEEKVNSSGSDSER